MRNFGKGIAVVVILTVFGCSSDPSPELQMEVERLRADLEMVEDEKQRLGQTTERLKDEIRELLNENRQLTERLEMKDIEAGDQVVAKLEKEIARLEGEVQRYKDGLVRAVDELNKQADHHKLEQYVAQLETRQAKRAASANRRSSPPSSSSGQCCVYVYDPYVTDTSQVDGNFVVEGEFENGRDAEIRGDLIIEVFDGNEVRYSDRASYSVPSDLRDGYRFDFKVAPPRSGSYRVRARWEDDPRF